MKLATKVRSGLAAVALAFCAGAALAQAPVEVPFFFPVAVGGPITKIIDGYAADFEKDNPGIKLRPIYSGSYQDTIANSKWIGGERAGDRMPPHPKQQRFLHHFETRESSTAAPEAGARARRCGTAPFSSSMCRATRPSSSVGHTRTWPRLSGRGSPRRPWRPRWTARSATSCTPPVAT